MYTPPEWKNAARNKAEEILHEAWESNPFTAPVPIKEIIELYVGDVHVETSLDPIFKEGISAFATKDIHIGWIVVANGRECIERQRFSLAHELAHIVLAPAPKTIEYCSTDKSSWVEKLCDYFAGYILMPEKFVRDIYQENPKPYIGDVAKTFKVSEPVAEIQLKLLKLPFNKMSPEDIPF